MIVFTSISMNYLPKAFAMAASLRRFHTNWQIHLLINDKITREDQALLDAKIAEGLIDQFVLIDALPIENKANWIRKHTLVELCTATKGVYLKVLADSGADKILYIDPDMIIFNSLEPVEKRLDESAILLAPHLLDYDDTPQAILDNEIMGAMRHGTFNLGFLAINATREDGRRFVDWWYLRLRDYCYASYPNGLFTDQKWCDFVPSFFADHTILRDPGYDVASWNLNKRTLSIDGYGQMLVNEVFPLRIFHFTGYDSGAGALMTSIYGDSNPVVAEIWTWYGKEIEKFGHSSMKNRVCAYAFDAAGKLIKDKDRQALRKNIPS